MPGKEVTYIKKKKAEMCLLKVTSMKNVRVPWCPTRHLIILMPFDALPGCDTGSYFAPGDLEPFPKKKKKRNQHRKLVYPSVISPLSQESH